MQKFIFTIVFLLYVTALCVNFIPSIKYPDSKLLVIGLILSSIFAISLLYFATYDNRLRNVFLIGAVAGIIVCFVKWLEPIYVGNLLFDIVMGVHYPLYVLFVTPLFGLNRIVAVDYGLFSLMMAVLYALCYGIVMLRAKATTN